jgi:hypothetical protein
MALSSPEEICQIAQFQSVFAIEPIIKCCASEFYSYSTTAILELSFDT